MARKEKGSIDAAAYLHDDAKRLNNPEAGNIDRVPKVSDRRKTYNWDPREAPQLVWSGKAGLKMAESKEEMSFEVPLVNLHIHERVAPEAILRAARREDAQRSLFADPVMDFSKEIQFYQHEVDWSNRMILGDSLQVMASLLEREGMRGKVQMIYLDPPYGIKFGSNFQPRIDKRDVKDGADEDLTREVEQVQAFRDTWELGVHSYLSYLRDRLILARELLSESGSVFVQIGDENVHRVRALLDEVFGEEGFVSQIAFSKTSSATSETLSGVCDYILVYARNLDRLKYRQVYLSKVFGEDATNHYGKVLLSDFSTRVLTADEKRDPSRLQIGSKPYTLSDLTSQRPPGSFPVSFRGSILTPRTNYWKTGLEGFRRLIPAGRVEQVGSVLR